MLLPFQWPDIKISLDCFINPANEFLVLTTQFTSILFGYYQKHVEPHMVGQCKSNTNMATRITSAHCLIKVMTGTCINCTPKQNFTRYSHYSCSTCTGGGTALAVVIPLCTLDMCCNTLQQSYVHSFNSHLQASCKWSFTYSHHYLEADYPRAFLMQCKRNSPNLNFSKFSSNEIQEKWNLRQKAKKRTTKGIR